MSSVERKALENYTAGVNAAIERFGRWIAPEVWLLGVDPEPWSVEQSLAIGLLMQLDLSWAMGREIERATAFDRLGAEVAVELWGWSPFEVRDWIPPGKGTLFAGSRARGLVGGLWQPGVQLVGCFTPTERHRAPIVGE